MIFKFDKPISEKIYDNHGCPWLTEYTLNFTVDNISWQAKFADTWSGVDIYFDYQCIASIKCSHKLNYEKIYQAIENEFNINEKIKQIILNSKRKILSNIKDKYYDKLMQDYNW